MSEVGGVRDWSPLLAAARLAHPWDPAPLEAYTSEQLLAAAVTLQSHKVSLMALRQTHGNSVLDTPLAAVIDEERSRYRREREEYEKIRLGFAGGGIDAMLFKSTGLFPSFHYLSANLDVIVPDGRARDARNQLKALGYVELLNIEEPGKFLFRRFPGDGSSFAFHLHEVVGWGVPFLDNEPLWAGARTPAEDPDILIPGPREALLVTIAHWFYEDKELALGNLFLTANALWEWEGTLCQASQLAADKGWEDGFWGGLQVFDRAWSDIMGTPFLSATRRNELDDGLRASSFVRDHVVARVRYGPDVPARLPFLRNKMSYYRKIALDPSRSFWRKIGDVVTTVLWAVRWKLHIRSQRGLLVSVSGCDGSGKTLQVQRLRGALDACDIRNRVIWSRGASSRGIAPFLRLGKFIASVRSRDASVQAGDSSGEAGRFEQRQRLLRRPFPRLAFATLFAIDLAWTYCVRTRLAMLAGNVVLCDRYVYDALVDYTLYTGCSLSELPASLRWLERASPRPHVPVLLDVDPDEALRRKPEEGDTGHLARARETFVGLAHDRNLLVMPADHSADEVQSRTVGAVLNAFYDRYGTLCNKLLCSNPSQLNPRPGVR